MTPAWRQRNEAGSMRAAWPEGLFEVPTTLVAPARVTRGSRL